MHIVHRDTPLPRIPALLLHTLLPRAERDEIVADLTAEYVARTADDGRTLARRWLWRQALGSVLPLIRWTSWRSRTGFEPRANAFRPGGPMLKTLFADASYAARRLRARPGYTVLSILTLALGVGGTTAVFGVARPAMFDPLPFANTNEVGAFWMSGWWTEEEYLYMRDKFAGFQDVAADRPGDITWREGDGPARLVPGLQTSANFFRVLGARPMLGRTFQTGDDTRGAEPAVVISYGLWEELGGTSAVVGKRLTLDGVERTVVGVMPRGFWYPNPSVRLWVAKPLDPEARNGSYSLLGRVAPGQDVRRMGASISRITAALHERFTYGDKDDRTRNAIITPLRDDLVGPMRPALVATLIGMGLILLIASTNVAALMLGQVEGRATELSVRAALGATRARLAQQLIVEAVLLGMGAGLLGGAVAAGGFRLMAHALPIGAWAESASFDWTLFVVALLIALAAVLLVVLVPLISLWRGDLRGALSRARTGGLQGRGGKMERGLVVAEVALAMFIAAGAALLVRSVANLYAVDAGVRTSGLAVVDVLSSHDMKSSERAQKIEEMTAALSALPGVRLAVATSKLPLRGGGDSFGITIEGHGNVEDRAFTYFRFATPGWFETMGITLRQGRVFDASDRAGAERVVVINEALAKKYFPGEDPVGKRMGGGLSGTVRVIGVVANVAEAKLTDDAAPVRYYPAAQVPWFGNNITLVIRTARAGDVASILDAARSTVQRVAPAFAVQGTTTMSRVLDTAVGPARQIMMLLGLLAALALVLGAIGIYGVISHFATRRRRDWAIRVALGLPGSHVVRHVVGQGVRLAVIGIALGAVGAAALARVLSTFLFGVGTVDFLSFAAASAALLIIGAAAAYIPARRAGTVDPALVLREQ